MAIGVLFYFTGTISEILNLDSYLDISLKILIIILICIYAIKRDDFNSFFNIKFSPVYLMIIIIPVIFSIIIQACPLDFEPYPEFLIVTVVGTITTAIWEELFFRYIGCSLFEENGKYKWYNVIFLALVFSLTHLTNLLFDGMAIDFTQVIFTFALGIFLLALYIHTKSIIVPIIAHFCVNSVSDYYTLFATEEAHAYAYIGNSLEIVFMIYILVLIFIGLYILKRNNHFC